MSHALLNFNEIYLNVSTSEHLNCSFHCFLANYKSYHWLCRDEKQSRIRTDGCNGLRR